MRERKDTYGGSPDPFEYYSGISMEEKKNCYFRLSQWFILDTHPALVYFHHLKEESSGSIALSTPHKYP
jgi:hypothetical protein